LKRFECQANEYATRIIELEEELTKVKVKLWSLPFFFLKKWYSLNFRRNYWMMDLNLIRRKRERATRCQYLY
jgi:hypothetical protein